MKYLYLVLILFSQLVHAQDAAPVAETAPKAPVSKVYLVIDITALHFTWADLHLENEMGFIKPLSESWLKYLNDNKPSSVEEIVMCDSQCMIYHSSWMEARGADINVPAEFERGVFLKTSLFLKRTSELSAVQDVAFEWEGRSLLMDIATKRFLGSVTLPMESRKFKQTDQKALNSSLASSLYRTPMPAFMQFKKILSEKTGFNRASKLVIMGQKHMGDVLALMELIKARGTSLGIDVNLDLFTKQDAQLTCFYRGEEKSFTDLLLSLKELKSTHSYTLVNEFTGVHHVLKLVTE